MRRGLTFGALAILLTSCAGAQGPLQAVPAPSVSPAIGLDDVAARQAVRDFVQAYADLPQDGGKGLFPLATGSLMYRWIHWTEVENQAFQGTITGEATIDSVGPIIPLKLTLADGSAIQMPGVRLRASVTYQFTSATDGSLSKTMSLDGLVGLASSAPGLWQVQQFTQDGRQLQEFVAPVDVRKIGDDVTVTFDTLILTSDHWTIGVHVTNRSSVDVPVEDALLTQPSGTPIARVQLRAPASIPAGKSADILVEMLPQSPVAGNLAVALLLGTSGGDRPFVVTLDQLTAHVPLTTSPAPSPSASPSSPPSPS